MNSQTRLCWLAIGTLVLGVALIVWPSRGSDTPKKNDPPPARLRRPVALVLADKDKYLFVANRTGGSVTTIDVAMNRVVAETPVGRTLADLCLTPDEKHLLAVDENADELLLLTRNGPALEAAARV